MGQLGRSLQKHTVRFEEVSETNRSAQLTAGLWQFKWRPRQTSECYAAAFKLSNRMEKVIKRS